jgi:hypothetical protein
MRIVLDSNILVIHANTPEPSAKRDFWSVLLLKLF